MANTNLTPEQRKEVWTRGEAVLSQLLGIYPVEELEAIGIYLSNPENRKGIGYAKLMGSLKKIIKDKNLKSV